MKKLSLLLAAAIVAVSAHAGKPVNHVLMVKNAIMPICPEMSRVDMKSVKGNMPQQAPVTDPQGTAVSYDRAGQAVVLVTSWDGAYVQVAHQGGLDRVTIVYGEDNKVYLKNIVYGSASRYGNYWVEGTIQGNEIHVPLGQTVYSFEEEGVDVVLGWGTTYLKNDEYFTIEVDERADYAIYTLNSDGTISLDGTHGKTDIDPKDDDSYCATGLALVYAGNEQYAGGWDGFIEWNTVLSEHVAADAPEVITQAPEGCEVADYYRNSACIASSAYGISATTTDGKIKVAMDAHTADVYIQNPSWNHDNLGSWVKGHYDQATGIISIPTGQFLSYDTDREYGIQLGWGRSEVVEDVDPSTGEVAYGLVYSIDNSVNEIQLQTTAQGTYYLMGSEGNIKSGFPYNYEATGLMTYYSSNQSFTSIEFANREANGEAQPMFYTVDLVPAIPANPTADEWYDAGDEFGYSHFAFTLPRTDVDGAMISPEHLSYSLFIDNGNGPEQFIFTATDYRLDLTEDIIEVPYSLYSSAIDFHSSYVYMYHSNMPGFVPLFTRNIGIQVYYTVDGEKNASDIAWLYDIDTGIDEVNAGKTVASVRYYNAAGQQLAQPSGLTIQVTTFTDGTVSTAKVVR